ncbi:hypothetical protein [Capnocytophaga canimorsus]|uniref:hypothetical protein n=1 Tax=Capnocytophaga canimorsus TaxID=28188 RepID=UPI001EE153FB|nr:hypothetical protein [Capnocytophaga canimorsus]GJQ04015.1 hypothetical protein CAPN009_04300 [Capnocytophaga canimorsus]
MEKGNVIILLVIAILFAFGMMYLFETTSEKIRINEKNSISYMEQAGTGVVLGKRLVGKDNNTEVAIQFKDTILYSNNREWYYLLKEGDSIKVEGKRIFKVAN